MYPLYSTFKKTIALDFGKKNLMLDFLVYGRALLFQSLISFIATSKGE